MNQNSTGTNDHWVAELEALCTSAGPSAAIDRLIESLRAEKDYRRLFDALLLKKRFEMGLPLAQPTSLDVPDEHRDVFEEAFIATARDVGGLFLEDGRLAQAWAFLNMIREPQPIRDALEQIEAPRDANEETEELIRIALYEGAHPVKGLEFLLRTHGTCNTITAFNQHVYQLKPEDRKRAAALMVREVYSDVRQSVRRDIEHRQKNAAEQAREAGGGSPPVHPAPSSETSLRALIAERPELLAEGNYHVDVSHLNAVVGFARFLDRDAPELALALELAEYGSRLSEPLRYPGDPPFEDFYPAHLAYFRALEGDDGETGLGYFRRKLETEPDEQDRPMLAYVLVDLLVRTERLDEAVDVAAAHLTDLDESSGFSFAELCQKAGRMDVLQRVALEKGDVVRYTAALVQAPPP